MDADPRQAGYRILRAAIPAERLEQLRERFELGVRPSEDWPYPREPGSRLAKLDDDPLVRSTCLLPALLDAVGSLMDGPFRLAVVEGRDPGPGGGGQQLHRDWLEAGATGTVVSGLAFLDDFGPDNGATRLVPGSHLDDDDEAGRDAIVASGAAGDVLLFDARLVHGGSTNVGGRPRRSLHVSYFGDGVPPHPTEIGATWPAGRG